MSDITAQETCPRGCGELIINHYIRRSGDLLSIVRRIIGMDPVVETEEIRRASCPTCGYSKEEIMNMMENGNC